MYAGGAPCTQESQQWKGREACHGPWGDVAVTVIGRRLATCSGYIDPACRLILQAVHVVGGQVVGGEMHCLTS